MASTQRFSRSRQLSSSKNWIKVSRLPGTGDGLLNQANFLIELSLYKTSGRFDQNSNNTSGHHSSPLPLPLVISEHEVSNLFRQQMFRKAAGTDCVSPTASTSPLLSGTQSLPIPIPISLWSDFVSNHQSSSLSRRKPWWNHKMITDGGYHKAFLEWKQSLKLLFQLQPLLWYHYIFLQHRLWCCGPIQGLSTK